MGQKFGPHLSVRGSLAQHRVVVPIPSGRVTVQRTCRVRAPTHRESDHANDPFSSHSPFPSPRRQPHRGGVSRTLVSSHPPPQISPPPFLPRSNSDHVILRPGRPRRGRPALPRQLRRRRRPPAPAPPLLPGRRGPRRSVDHQGGEQRLLLALRPRRPRRHRRRRHLPAARPLAPDLLPDDLLLPTGEHFNSSSSTLSALPRDDPYPAIAVNATRDPDSPLNCSDPCVLPPSPPTATSS